ncbi:MAG: hypothetical protein KBD44_00670 [Candidatus Pacebacteria bacterium]|nr:hypothetical protein [Candidatus Paceibacterota bacterium]
MTLIHSLNTWSGGCDGFHPFIQQIAEKSSFLALQEVHDALAPMPDTIMPCDPGSREFPIRPKLRAELDDILGTNWQKVYAHHVIGMHDLEADNRVRFGQYTAVKRDVWRTLSTYSNYVYGPVNRFNSETEAGDGSPCSKVATATHVVHIASGEEIIIVNVHGFWSLHGKIDMMERREQNRGIDRLVRKTLSQHAARSPHILVIGDLNYTSQMDALTHLALQPCFGENGGVILNHTYGTTSTRTKYYKKPVREADFAIASRSLLQLIADFKVFLDGVPSDHGLIELTLIH